MNEELKKRVEDLYDSDETIEAADANECLIEVIGGLEDGSIRVVELDSGKVSVNEWVKKAILLYFKFNRAEPIQSGIFSYYDKVPLRQDFEKISVRAVPGSVVRRGAFLGPRVVLMPSFVNIGAYVAEDTMVDTWATVGSCAYIGKRVHLAGGVGIGGVLEPPNAIPVVVEDDAFIGSRAMITDGARVGKGAVLGAGVILNPSIPVIDAYSNEEISRGEVPPFAVCINGARRRAFGANEFYLPCVLVIKYLDPDKGHDKTKLNELLRSF